MTQVQICRKFYHSQNKNRRKGFSEPEKKKEKNSINFVGQTVSIRGQSPIFCISLSLSATLHPTHLFLFFLFFRGRIRNEINFERSQFVCQATRLSWWRLLNLAAQIRSALLTYLHWMIEEVMVWFITLWFKPQRGSSAGRASFKSSREVATQKAGVQIPAMA